MNIPNYLTDKASINQLWKGMVEEARDSLRIFAGDISWIDRDEIDIKTQVSQGRKVFVICRRPVHEDPQATSRLKKLMKRLLLSGAEVRYYQEILKHEPKIRGLLMNRLYYSVGLKVTKSPKPLVNELLNNKLGISTTLATDVFRGAGVPGNEQKYDYYGIVYVPPTHIDDLIDMHELFDRIWYDSLLSMVLDGLTLATDDYVNLLKSVPHYSNLTRDDVRIETVHTYDLWAACQVVKDYKFDVTKAVIDAYITQKLPLFTPSFAVYSGNKRTILLPPILERHGNKLVVIDGMHRLYYATFFAKVSQVNCVVISPPTGLPGQPIPFNQVVVRSEKPSDRRQNFKEFQPAFFRQMDELDKKLFQLAQEFDSNTVVEGIDYLRGGKKVVEVVSDKDFEYKDAVEFNSKRSDNPLKILFLGVNPHNTDRLRIDLEIRNIKQALRESEFRREFRVEQEWAVRVTDLQKHLLNYRPNIVHVSGHGSSADEILLEDEHGNAKSVTGHALGHLFAEFKDDIRCVILNVCFSEEQARSIANHIDSVIGISDEIRDEDSVHFSSSFYQALGAGRSLRSAFNLGLNQLSINSENVSNIPAMLFISGDSDVYF